MWLSTVVDVALSASNSMPTKVPERTLLCPSSRWRSQGYNAQIKATRGHTGSQQESYDSHRVRLPPSESVLSAANHLVSS